MPSARIEEVTETPSHIVQAIDHEEDSESNDESDDENPFDFLQVFATEKKKRETRRSKLPELQSSVPPSASAAPFPSTSATSPAPATASLAVPPTHTATAPPVPTAPSTLTRAAPQNRYQSTAEDQRLISELQSWLMEGKLAHTTPAHIFAASPTIRGDLVERLRVRRVETSSYEEAIGTTVSNVINQDTPPISLREPAYSLKIHYLGNTFRGLSMRLPVPSVATLATVALIIFINAMTQFNCQILGTIERLLYAYSMAV